LESFWTIGSFAFWASSLSSTLSFFYRLIYGLFVPSFSATKREERSFMRFFEAIVDLSRHDLAFVCE